MVSRCNVCMSFKRSGKSRCKKCSRRRRQRGRGINSFFKKAKRLIKKMANSDIGKLAISQGLAYAPKLLDLGASKIKNKKVRQLLQSEMTKRNDQERSGSYSFKAIKCQLEVLVFQLKTWKVF